MIYLGPLYKPSDEGEILKLSSGGASNASNNFQINLLDGFFENRAENLRIINVLPVGIWPKAYKKMCLPYKTWKYRNCEAFEIGGVNLPVVKQISRELSVKKLLRKLTATDKEILIYSTYLPFLRAVMPLDSDVKVTLIVTDLPEYYDFGRTSCLKRLLRRINNVFIHRALKRVDRFVLLTEYMHKPLDVGERPYVVVEGICAAGAEKPIRGQNRIDSEKEIIFYSGSLQSHFGINNLLDAFEMIDREDVELWLCGAGDSAEYIKELAEKDSRIRFYGYVSHEEVAKLRSQATIMVNPRTSEGEYTKYSFPSKTMEYMLSERPVVMCRLPGIPREYEDYVFFTEDSSVDALYQKLLEVLSYSPEKRKNIGMKAARYVAEEKNPTVQAKRILQLMSLL